jgi:hypothetical protein
MSYALGKQQEHEVAACEMGQRKHIPRQKPKRGVTMEQEISMVYLNERIPFPRYFTPSDLRSIVGEKYCSTGDLIVLEKAGNKVTVITSEENFPCVDELSKALLQGKKISVRVTDKGELHRLLKKICNFFGFIH